VLECNNYTEKLISGVLKEIAINLTLIQDGRAIRTNTESWKTNRVSWQLIRTKYLHIQNPTMRSVPMDGLHDGNIAVVEESERNIATSIH